jgi:HEAT repeat protein
LLANLKRIEGAAWLANAEAWLPSLSEKEQKGAVHFVEHAHFSAEQRCDFYDLCLSGGGLAARRAASAALGKCEDPRVPNLIERCLENSDGEVRANAVALIRLFHLPRAIERLLNCLAVPDEKVRSTARAALSEFEFTHFLAAFDTLDDDLRRSTGRIVRYVDPNAAEAVEQELRSDSRVRRRRGIAIASALGLVNELAEELGRLLHDADPYLRWDAVTALAQEDSPTIRRLLRGALFDVHPLVHQAAEEALLKRTVLQSPPIEMPAAEPSINISASGATR